MYRSVLLVLVGLSLMAPAAWADNSSDKKADEIIAKYIQAIGGKKKLDSMKTMRMTAKSVFQGGMEAPLVMEFKRPNKMRIEFTFQGMTGTQAYDGENGWTLMPFMGQTQAEEVPSDQLKNLRNQADLTGPLVDYASKGHKVEYDGVEDVSGTSAHKLKLTRGDGEVEYYFVDSERFVPIVVKGKRSMQGMEMEYETLLGDYKDVDGIKMAHSMEQRAGGMATGNKLVIEKIELNVDLPDDRFAMPKGEKTEDKLPKDE
jgi:outer membrane lipoprotein-sorting protein